MGYPCQVHVKPADRKTWDFHSQKGHYLFTSGVLAILGDCQQPENALATLLSLIRSARTTERLVTAPRGDTYFNERPRGRRGEYLARREAKLANKREGESDGEGKEARPGDHPT